MEISYRCRRYIVVATGCFVLATAGLLGSITAAEDAIKKRLSISQKQMELVISMANLGFNVGLPCGLILERFGPRWASVSALCITSLGYLVMFFAVVYAESFHSMFWLLVVLFSITGFGSMHMYMNGVAINAYNFKVESRGTVIGVIACFYFIGTGIYSLINIQVFGPEHLAPFFVFCIVMTSLANITGFFLLRKIEPPPDEEPKTNEAKENIENLNVDQMPEEVHLNGAASENDNLVQGQTPLKIVYYGELSVIAASKTADFHYILWPFVFSSSVSFMYSFSMQVFLKSFHLLSWQATLMFLGPIMAAVFKVSFGILSDITLRKFSRVWYLIGTLAVQTIVTFLNCFFGDQTAILVITAIVQFVALGVFMAMVPIILSDNFGTTYFASIWGTVTLVSGLGNLGLSCLMGALYDVHIKDSGDTCYGLKCFEVIFIISTVLCVIGFILLLILYKRQLNRWKSEQNLTDGSTFSDKDK